MNLPLSNCVVARLLAGLAVFGALSALGGAALAIAVNGAGVPLEYLAHTPFSSYVVPGLVLGGIVGGTQVTAAVALLGRWRRALLYAAIAGFGMLIWIFVELALIRHYSWLQAVYFGLGGLELILVFALLGIAPSLVDPLRGSDEMPNG